MNGQERGLYIDLLALAWDSEPQGTLPVDLGEITRQLSGWNRRSLAKLLAKFPESFVKVSTILGERLANPKMFEQVREIEQRKQILSDAAKHTNEKRWGMLSPSESPSDRSASASATAKPKTLLPPASREGSGLHEVAVSIGGGREVVIVKKPPGRRLWTQREHDALVGGRGADYVRFFKHKGFEAWIEEPIGAPH